MAGKEIICSLEKDSPSNFSLFYLLLSKVVYRKIIHISSDSWDDNYYCITSTHQKKISLSTSVEKSDSFRCLSSSCMKSHHWFPKLLETPNSDSSQKATL